MDHRSLLAISFSLESHDCKPRIESILSVEFSLFNHPFKSQFITTIRIGLLSFNLLENVGTQSFLPEIISDANLFRISQMITAINAFPHTPSNSNVLALLLQV